VTALYGACQIAILCYVGIGVILSLWMAAHLGKISATDAVRLFFIPFIWFPLAVREVQRERRRLKAKSQERQL